MTSDQCVNCGNPTRTNCTNCDEPLCGECNEDLNLDDDDQGDGMCWTCREKAAGTFIGEDPEAADWLQELNEDYCHTRL